LRATESTTASGPPASLPKRQGWSLVKTNACEIGGFRRRQLVITGSKGTLELKPLEIKEGIQYRTPMTEYFDEEWEDAGKSSMSESYHRYAPMLLSFAQMVRGEKENPWSPDYELALFETIFAGYPEILEKQSSTMWERGSSRRISSKER